MPILWASLDCCDLPSFIPKSQSKLSEMKSGLYFSWLEGGRHIEIPGLCDGHREANARIEKWQELVGRKSYSNDREQCASHEFF